MSAEKKPEVIDLNRYRKAAVEKQAKAAAAAAKATPREGILGGRKNAGVLLILVILAAVALSVLPRLF